MGFLTYFHISHMQVHVRGRRETGHVGQGERSAAAVQEVPAARLAAAPVPRADLGPHLPRRRVGGHPVRGGQQRGGHPRDNLAGTKCLTAVQFLLL